jgi:hypothetical protein
MKTIFCHNTAHLGDCIQSLHFLIKAAELNNVEFKFNCNQEYFKQLKEFTGSRIKFVEKKEESSIETWVDGHQKYYNYQKESTLDGGFKDQSKTFLLHWQDVSKIMQIECPFKNKKDLVYDEEILNDICNHNQNYDYLIINSKPLSGQCSFYSESAFINLINNIIQKNKTLITTRKIENFPCTTDYDLSVVEIGKLSKNVKNIYAVNTGPLHLCINKWTVDKVNFTIFVSNVGSGCGSETFNFGPNFMTKSSILE